MLTQKLKLAGFVRPSVEIQVRFMDGQMNSKGRRPWKRKTCSSPNGCRILNYITQCRFLQLHDGLFIILVHHSLVAQIKTDGPMCSLFTFFLFLFSMNSFNKSIFQEDGRVPKAVWVTLNSTVSQHYSHGLIIFFFTCK